MKSSPKKLSADCRSIVGRQTTDSLPTANQQVTDRLGKKEKLRNLQSKTRPKTLKTISYLFSATKSSGVLGTSMAASGLAIAWGDIELSISKNKMESIVTNVIINSFFVFQSFHHLFASHKIHN